MTCNDEFAVVNGIVRLIGSAGDGVEPVFEVAKLCTVPTTKSLR